MKKDFFITVSLILLIISPIYSTEPEWITLPEMPRARFGHCSVVFHDKIWIIGGKSQMLTSIKKIDCFNLITGEWERDASELEQARYNAAALVYHDTIFVIGGHNDRQILNSVEYYDPNDNKFKEFSPLLYPREGASAVVFDGKLHVIGGRSNIGFFPTILDNVEYWDAVARTWQESANWHLQKARALMQSVVVDSFVYTLGGRWIDDLLDLVERFGPTTGSESLSSLPSKRFYFSAVKIQNLIYVIGGVQLGDFELLNDSIDYYATDFDQWYSLSIPISIPRAGLSAISYNNDIYVFGGMDSNFRILNTAEILTGIDTTISAITSDQIRTQPVTHDLLSNYPNPFNSATTITVQLARDEDQVELIIFNLLGQQVRKFQLTSFRSGNYQIQWDGRDEYGRTVESGIYLAQLRSDRNHSRILKISFVK